MYVCRVRWLLLLALPQLACRSWPSGRCWLAAVGFAAAGFHDPYIRGKVCVMMKLTLIAIKTIVTCACYHQPCTYLERQRPNGHQDHLSDCMDEPTLPLWFDRLCTKYIRCPICQAPIWLVCCCISVSLCYTHPPMRQWSVVEF